MKTLRFLPLALSSVVLLLSLSTGIGAAAEPGPVGAVSGVHAASATSGVPAASAASGIACASAASEADHIVTGAEIQSRFDQKIHSEAADRQAIRELLARPEVRRVAGNAGLDLQRADAAVGILSGAELSRLATQARLANSEIAGGATVTMTWTMVIIIVVALVVLIAIL
jgi:hypothetical protein